MHRVLISDHKALAVPAIREDSNQSRERYRGHRTGHSIHQSLVADAGMNGVDGLANAGLGPIGNDALTCPNAWTSAHLEALQTGQPLVYFGKPATVRRVISSGVTRNGCAYKIIEVRLSACNTVTAMITLGEAFGILAPS